MTTKKNTGILLVASMFLLAAVSLVFAGVETIAPSPFWKNQVEFPDDVFCASGDSGWVKFTILLLEPYGPNIVYFQDSRQYVLHYDFSTNVVDPFVGMTAGQYYGATLYARNQQASLGTVIMSPMDRGTPKYAEYGIQFIRQDPYTKEEIRDMFNLVKVNIVADPEIVAFYFPTYEQRAVAEAESDWFEAQGIPVSSTSRWAEGNPTYSQGWALGKVTYVEAGRIDAAYQNGTLKPGDILLTNDIPAEIPYVAGILSLAPATPSSHVAILAQTYNVPFVHLAIAEDVNTAQQLIGHRIVFSAYESFDAYELRLLDIEGKLTEEQITQILELKKPPHLAISPIANVGAYSANSDILLPSDVNQFGGKGSNFGILRTSIPDNSPVATVLSFDLWNDFLDQPITSRESTLREEIANRLARYSTYPPSDMAALSKDLSTIRNLFKDINITRFTPAQIDTIKGILLEDQYGFDMNSKLRFRSSTNVEDSEQFTGAGLYASHSGCLADEFDGDHVGPCLCDPNKTKERGVLRAIRRTWASFYNDNAFLERLRHDVNEAEVGMAVLVHHSFPDEIELANGVATLEKRASGQDAFIKLVTQTGAVSVTNPEGGSIPEEVNGGLRASGNPRSLVLVRESSLIPRGATVMDWKQDYRELIDLLVAVSHRYQEITGKTTYVLDLEYKKVAPGGTVLPAGGLVVKQVRPIPQPDETPAITPFLLSETADYTVFPGEFENIDPVDIFATHRLKSRWTLETRSCWLDELNLGQSLYTNIDIEYVDGKHIDTISGQMPLLPFAKHSFDETNTYDSWRMDHLANARTYTLQTNITPRLVSQAECPIFLLKDLALQPVTLSESRFGVLRLNVEYDEPVRAIHQERSWTDPASELAASTANQLYLWRSKHTEGDLVYERFYAEPGVASISTSFYVPPPPKNESWVMRTAPGVEWIETVIEGFTSTPISLHGFYSQTFHPWHHNIFEYFLFEPRLEPGIAQDILDELAAQDIRLIYLELDTFGGETQITTFGFDDVFDN